MKYSLATVTMALSQQLPDHPNKFVEAPLALRQLHSVREAHSHVPDSERDSLPAVDE